MSDLLNLNDDFVSVSSSDLLTPEINAKEKDEDVTPVEETNKNTESLTVLDSGLLTMDSPEDSDLIQDVKDVQETRVNSSSEELNEPEVASSVITSTGDDEVLLEFGNEAEPVPESEEKIKGEDYAAVEELTPPASESESSFFQFEDFEPKSEPIETLSALADEVDPEPVSSTHSDAFAAATNPSVLAFGNNASPTSDDRPVKMPKTTTVAPPNKTALARSSSNACSSGRGKNDNNTTQLLL